jgi:hypothetical protein
MVLEENHKQASGPAHFVWCNDPFLCCLPVNPPHRKRKHSVGSLGGVFLLHKNHGQESPGPVLHNQTDAILRPATGDCQDIPVVAMADTTGCSERLVFIVIGKPAREPSPHPPAYWRVWRRTHEPPTVVPFMGRFAHQGPFRPLAHENPPFEAKT